MTLSTMDIPYSPDMGGKEALSALGWSRTLKRDHYEQWKKDDDPTCMIAITVTGGNGYADGRYSDDEDTYGLPLAHDELLACARRIEELRAGDAE